MRGAVRPAVLARAGRGPSAARCSLILPNVSLACSGQTHGMNLARPRVALTEQVPRHAAIAVPSSASLLAPLQRLVVQR